MALEWRGEHRLYTRHVIDLPQNLDLAGVSLSRALPHSLYGCGRISRYHDENYGLFDGVPLKS